MRRTAALQMIATVLLLVPFAAAKAEEGLKLSGSYKNLLLRSEDVSGKSNTLDLNRLRLEIAGNLAPAVRLDLQYDNEVLLGSYLRTTEFAALRDLPSLQYWGAESDYLERSEALGRHRLHRAAITFSAGNVDLRVGRQRIAWGTGRFWSPLDILNPVSPTALEREERLGVDAALLEAKLGPLSRLSLVYAPQREAARTSRALQWHGNTRGVDFSVVAGRLLGQDVVGLDLAGEIGAAGIRLELTRQWPLGGAAFTRLMVGADYAFANTLTLSAELYYNGGGHWKQSDPDPESDFGTTGLHQPLTQGTRYAGLFTSYDLSPLLRWTNHLVVNVDDRSRALDSRLTWSLQQSLDLTLGLRYFSSPLDSEYGRGRDSIVAQLHWFF